MHIRVKVGKCIIIKYPFMLSVKGKISLKLKASMDDKTFVTIKFRNMRKK